MSSKTSSHQQHFKVYSSIENHYQDFAKQLQLDPNFDSSIPWVATEKIHGCNFSFIIWNSRKTEPGHFEWKVASRRQLLLDQNDAKSESLSNHDDGDNSVDDFFPEAVGIIKQKYKSMVEQLFGKLISKYTTENYIVKRANVYGEL